MNHNSFTLVRVQLTVNDVQKAPVTYACCSDVGTRAVTSRGSTLLDLQYSRLTNEQLLALNPLFHDRDRAPGPPFHESLRLGLSLSPSR
ncbi:hypothetical protein EIM92_12360 [Paenibacillus lentus]|uniref:Uncharacterized protein n=1 Tax=Paenibacillus lentus TaxID=1338368 RepID=A0A3S8RV32_9BACL|nr:hypothetical protein EIM92_12360 [Paenibacillus lentus]